MGYFRPERGSQRAHMVNPILSRSFITDFNVRPIRSEKRDMAKRNEKETLVHTKRSKFGHRENAHIWGVPKFKSSNFSQV